MQKTAEKLGVNANVLKVASYTTGALATAGVMVTPAGPIAAGVALGVAVAKLGLDVQKELKHERIIRESNALGAYITNKHEAIKLAEKIGLSASFASTIGLNSIAKPEKTSGKLSKLTGTGLSTELEYLKTRKQRKKQALRDVGSTMKANLELLEKVKLSEQRPFYEDNDKRFLEEAKAIKQELGEIRTEEKQIKSGLSALGRENIISADSSTPTTKLQKITRPITNAMGSNGVNAAVHVVNTVISSMSLDAPATIQAIADIMEEVKNGVETIGVYAVKKHKTKTLAQNKQELKESVQKRRLFDDVPGYDNVNEIQRAANLAKIDNGALGQLAGKEAFRNGIATINLYNQQADLRVSSPENPELITKDQYDSAITSTNTMVEKAKITAIIAERFIQKSPLSQKDNKESALLYSTIKDSPRTKEQEKLLNAQIKAENPELQGVSKIFQRRKLVQEKLEDFIQKEMSVRWAEVINHDYDNKIATAKTTDEKQALIVEKDFALANADHKTNLVKDRESKRAEIFCQKYFESVADTSKDITTKVNEALTFANSQDPYYRKNTDKPTISTKKLKKLLADPSKTMDKYEKQFDIGVGKIGKVKDGAVKCAKKFAMVYKSKTQKITDPFALISENMTKLAIHKDEQIPEVLAKHAKQLESVKDVLASYASPPTRAFPITPKSAPPPPTTLTPSHPPKALLNLSAEALKEVKDLAKIIKSTTTDTVNVTKKSSNNLPNKRGNRGRE